MILKGWLFVGATPGAAGLPAQAYAGAMPQADDFPVGCAVDWAPSPMGPPIRMVCIEVPIIYPSSLAAQQRIANEQGSNVHPSPDSGTVTR